MEKLWTDKAWEDYLYWQTQDKKTRVYGFFWGFRKPVGVVAWTVDYFLSLPRKKNNGFKVENHETIDKSGLVPKRGVEPLRPCGRRILSRSTLPEALGM